MQLVEFFKKNNFLESDFRGFKTNRLIQLKSLIDKNKIDENLRLINSKIIHNK